MKLVEVFAGEEGPQSNTASDSSDRPGLDMFAPELAIAATGNGIVESGRVVGILTTEDGSTGWTADGGGCERIGKCSSFPSNSVENSFHGGLEDIWEIIPGSFMVCLPTHHAV